MPWRFRSRKWATLLSSPGGGEVGGEGGIERFGCVGRVNCWIVERMLAYGEETVEEVLGGAVGPRERPCVGSLGA